jgi:hypothetical protein
LLQAQEYTVRIPQAVSPARIELLARASGIGVLDWEITVGFDAARCEIFCTWRPRRDALGLVRPVRFLPPLAVVRFYAASGAAPDTFSVDPAGLRFPGASGELRFGPNPASGPEKCFQAEVPGRVEALTRPAVLHMFAGPGNGPPFLLSSTPLPLRI